MIIVFLSFLNTEDLCYNDSICPPRFCRQHEFAVIKNPNMYKYDE